MKILAVIPARMGSSRFPGKPMKKINGKPMIGHVYEKVKECDLLTDVIVATCDQKISKYISSIGGKAIMTSSMHERASDRTAEALEKLEKEKKIRYDLIVMVQGDEPMTEPAMISEALKPMLVDKSINIVNLYSEIKSNEEFNDKNCIKVVTDKFDNAIFFSREPIPNTKDSFKISRKKQVCIIPFKRKFLFDYQKMKPTPLEISESIDMLRVLENGLKVRMVKTEYETYAVDTKEDLIRVSKLMLQRSKI